MFISVYKHAEGTMCTQESCDRLFKSGIKTLIILNLKILGRRVFKNLYVKSEKDYGIICDMRQQISHHVSGRGFFESFSLNFPTNP